MAPPNLLLFGHLFGSLGGALETSTSVAEALKITYDERLEVRNFGNRIDHAPSDNKADARRAKRQSDRKEWRQRHGLED